MNLSRSVQRRVAAQKGEPAPTFENKAIEESATGVERVLCALNLLLSSERIFVQLIDLSLNLLSLSSKLLDLDNEKATKANLLN